MTATPALTDQAEPQPGTVRDHAGTPCPRATIAHYPLRAKCSTCDNPIVAAWPDSEWRHRRSNHPSCFADLDHQIRRLVDRLNAYLDLPVGSAAGAVNWRFGYVGNCSGTPGTPAWYDDRLWTVWAPHPGRIGAEHENLGYVRTAGVGELVDRLQGVLAYLRASSPVWASR